MAFNLEDDVGEVLEEDVECPSFSTESERYPTSAAGYELLHEVGHGSTATVWVARCKGQDFVAVKIFFLDHFKGDKGRAVQEVLTMRALQNDTILPVLAHFQDNSHVWMITPFVNGGSVSSIITQRHPQGLTERAIIGIGRPVLRALMFMHERRLMHRDVKAANVLVSENGRVYLADFGVVAPLDLVTGSTSSGGRTPERKRSLVQARHKAALSTFTGTPAWMAPEVVAPDEEVGYDERADIWSWSIMLLEMAQGEAPHLEEPLEQVVVSIANGEPPRLPEAAADGTPFSQELRDVVQQCLQKDPAARPSAVKLLQHSIMQDAAEGEDLVRELFTAQEPPSHKMRRVPSRSKSMAKHSAPSLMREEVASAVELLKKATAPEPPSQQAEHHHHHRLLRRPQPSLRLSQQDLAGCKGLVFGRAHKRGRIAGFSAEGSGFALARHVNSEGELFWSAPSFVQVIGHGVGLSIGAEELAFILVLRDMEHLYTAAATSSAVKANLSQSVLGSRVALQLRLGNAIHTAKLLSFADGTMFDMTILGWNVSGDTELNQRVYGEGKEPRTILQGGVRPPPEFDALFDQLQELERELPPLRAESECTLANASHGGKSCESAVPREAQWDNEELKVCGRSNTVHGGDGMAQS